MLPSIVAYSILIKLASFSWLSSNRLNSLVPPLVNRARLVYLAVSLVREQVQVST